MTRLIDADELKKKLQYVYSCDYIDSKSKEGIASDIIDEINNAPTVEEAIDCNKAYKEGFNAAMKIRNFEAGKELEAKIHETMEGLF